jgi:hypothetical protein
VRAGLASACGLATMRALIFFRQFRRLLLVAEDILDSNIESIPVSGVEIRNASVAPLDAPFLRSDIAVGRTPHEQSGSGTPKSAARNTDLKPGFPRCRAILSLSTNIWMTPAMNVPNSMYGAASLNVCQISLNSPVIMSILLYFTIKVV